MKDQLQRCETVFLLLLSGTADSALFFLQLRGSAYLVHLKEDPVGETVKPKMSASFCTAAFNAFGDSHEVGPPGGNRALKWVPMVSRRPTSFSEY